MYPPNPGKALGVFVDNVSSFIGRAIVHNNPLRRKDGLPKHAFDRETEMCLLIPNRGDDNVFRFLKLQFSRSQNDWLAIMAPGRQTSQQKFFCDLISIACARTFPHPRQSEPREKARQPRLQRTFARGTGPCASIGMRLGASDTRPPASVGTRSASRKL